jgi:hypothetical protein
VSNFDTTDCGGRFEQNGMLENEAYVLKANLRLHADDI